MRNIKFRGIPAENNTSYFEDEEFVYGYLVINDGSYYILLDVLDNIKRDDYAVYMIKVKQETLGQYTGLKDKSGKEIYEKDVVKVFTSKEWRIGKIIYEHSGFTIDVTNNKELEYGRTAILENLTEVIGNIYDNPELLEKGE